MSAARADVAVAEALLAASDTTTTSPAITASRPDFDMAGAYDVLAQIETARRGRGWQPVGRKIGFTNRTLWARYNVDGPMWARVWDRTLVDAPAGTASLALGGFVQPRLEPEVVFGLAAPLPVTDDAEELLASVAWMAPGFEIVHCHFSEWRFAAADCTADFGLHGALVVGPRVPVTEHDRAVLAETLATFTVALSREDTVMARGVGADVLDSPARALGFLARTVAGQPQFDQPAAGEIITTGTLTDAMPVAAGERWQSDYGTLGVDGLRISFSGDDA